jgi:hypothetical protein
MVGQSAHPDEKSGRRSGATPRSLLDLLRERPEGLSPREVAAEILRLEGPPELIERVARGALDEVPGARPGPDGRWRLPGPDGDRAIALEVRTTGSHPVYDQILAVGAAEILDGRVASTLSAIVRPDRPIPPSAALGAGLDPAALAAGHPLGDVLAKALPLLRAARPIAWSSDRPAAFLAHALRDEEPEWPPAPVLILAPAFRRAGLLPPRGGLPEACAALRVPVPEATEIGDVASAVAHAYLTALDRGVVLLPPAPRPRFDFGRTAFGPDLLAEIPDRPGVYRFYDRDDRLLYVGKSLDLRRRVSSYFGFRAARRKGHAALVDLIYRVAWDETGSELAALLAEIGQIREHAPPFNVQREVRRRRPAGGDLVIFLPGRESGEIDLLLVAAGQPVGRVRSDRRARGMREVRAALRRAFFTAGPPPEGDPGDAQIVATWLRAEGDRGNYLDLSEVGGIQEAARLVKAYLIDPELFTGKVIHR